MDLLFMNSAMMAIWMMAMDVPALAGSNVVSLAAAQIKHRLTVNPVAVMVSRLL